MIKRKLYKDLKEHLPKKEISLIIGPRQAGKTTLMMMLKEYLTKNNEPNLFFNLDIGNDLFYFQSQAKLLKKIELELGNKRGFIFIDEIQRKENAGLFLKGLFDMDLPYKFIVSGSGSLELKEKIHESLAGRKRVFELNTLSFKEFVNYKTNEKYKGKLNDYFKIESENVIALLEEYLSFGGYPRVVLENKIIEKRKYINEIYSSYIEKDISFLLNVQRVDAYEMLIKVLAGQIGRLVNHSEISNTIGISAVTLKNYLWYSEKTFITRRITPFFTNLRKEITKSPVYYFFDTGLRNFILNVFNTESINYENFGYVFENFVLSLLLEKIKDTSSKVNYWRTKDKSEVDFVINTGSRIIPFEVKYKNNKKIPIGRSLHNFIAKYDPEDAFIITPKSKSSIKIKNTWVRIIPFWELYSIKI
jgi:hypothetical protein